MICLEVGVRLICVYLFYAVAHIGTVLYISFSLPRRIILSSVVHVGLELGASLVTG